MKDKKHKITSICEFNINKNNDVVLKEIFAYKDNEFSLSKYKPRSYKRIKEKNIKDIDDIF